MKLIPYVSTHLRVLLEISDFTVGGVYRIIGWEEDDEYGTVYTIKDDRGMQRWWSYDEKDSYIEDASFEENLKNILSE